MGYEIAGKCFYCGKPTHYLVGVSMAGWRKKIDVTGETCQDHVTDALEKMGSLSFGTNYWPAVAGLDAKLLYHSFQADQHKLSVCAGWREYLLRI